MKKILLMSLLFSFLLVGVGCSNKKKELTIEEQIARNELAEKIMSKNRCAQIRDIVLEKYFGKDCKYVQCHGTAVVKFLERLTTVFLKDCLGFKPSNFFAYIARR